MKNLFPLPPKPDPDLLVQMNGRFNQMGIPDKVRFSVAKKLLEGMTLIVVDVAPASEDEYAALWMTAVKQRPDLERYGK